MKSLFDVTKKKVPSNLLRDRYLVPPFSIIDGKTGYWLERRRQWEVILQDRENNIRDTQALGNTPYILTDYWRKEFHVRSTRRISTFDPFLCEILIKWFSIEGMTILDPFAGGCVRGAVSSLLNRKYYGIDISDSQCFHNIKQWDRIIQNYEVPIYSPVWKVGDSEQIVSTLDSNYDMLLTCPPYYDLEKYTNLEQDLSNQDSYEDFIKKFTRILKKCFNVLKEDSFAVIVAAEIRAQDGSFYGFIPDIIRNCMEIGFHYYNEIILENRVVSLGVRCPKYFEQSRKIGRHHQNVLVFYKGDLSNIESKFGRFILEEEGRY